MLVSAVQADVLGTPINGFISLDLEFRAEESPKAPKRLDTPAWQKQP